MDQHELLLDVEAASVEGGQDRRRTMRLLLAVAIVAALLAIGFGGFIFMRHRDRPTPPKRPSNWHIKLPGRDVLPPSGKAPLVSPDDARALNAKAPFIVGIPKPARPFRFIGSTQDRMRAEQCLAAAQLYEAGYDAGDQTAVAQVVLNRVRHPAFPHSICAVVFEGSDRATGCQFTFTCDGALSRTYPEAAWKKARVVAANMLNGMVDPRVGWATHYHTNWVYPYWSPSLDKVAAVKSHLFFRWRGYWGTAAAFVAPYPGHEPLIVRLAGDETPPQQPEASEVNKVTQTDDTPETAHRPAKDIEPPPPMTREMMNGNSLRLVHPDGGGYGLLIRHGADADELVGLALRLCFGQSFCKVMGWSSVADIPLGFPISPSSMATLQFIYVRDPQASRATTRFDCKRFPRIKAEQCLDQ